VWNEDVDPFWAQLGQHMTFLRRAKQSLDIKTRCPWQRASGTLSSDEIRYLIAKAEDRNLGV